MRGQVIRMAAYREQKRWRMHRTAEITVPVRRRRDGRWVIRVADVRRELETFLGRKVGA